MILWWTPQWTSHRNWCVCDFTHLSGVGLEFSFYKWGYWGLGNYALGSVYGVLSLCLVFGNMKVVTFQWEARWFSVSKNEQCGWVKGRSNLNTGGLRHLFWRKSWFSWHREKEAGCHCVWVCMLWAHMHKFADKHGN